MRQLIRTLEDPLIEADSRLDRGRAAGFWFVALALFTALEVAHPPTVALGAGPGLALSAALGLAMGGYSLYLWKAGQDAGGSALALGCFGGALGIGISEWLCGGSASQLHLLFALNVVGCSAILSARGMGAYLFVASSVVLAPLLYGPTGTSEVANSVVFAVILWLEGLLVADFGERLRIQRRVLHAAEQASSEQARTDALTGLGNRRALEARLHELSLEADDGIAVISFDLNGFKFYNDRFGHAAGDALLRRLGSALAVAATPTGTAFRPGGDEFCIVADRPIEADSAVVRQFIEALTEHGPGFVVTPSCGVANIPRDADTPDQALRVADERMYTDKRGTGHAAGQEMSELLLRLVAEREPDLYEHVGDVVDLVGRVARRLGCSPAEVNLVARAAEQHDIGKLAIPDGILAKTGPLDDDEWALMRQHTVVGERILAGTPSLRPVARVVRSCHERWDGGGYPDGLAGEAIPRGARIIAACDAYAAMTADRAYRKAMTEDEALTELLRGAGTQFDPVIAHAVRAEARLRPITGASQSHR